MIEGWGNRGVEMMLPRIARFSVKTGEQATNPTEEVELTVGPAGGFRSARLELEYDGRSQIVETHDRALWLQCIEPLVRKSGCTISTTKLPRKA